MSEKEKAKTKIEDEYSMQRTYRCIFISPFEEFHNTLFERVILSLPSMLPNQRLAVDRADVGAPSKHSLEEHVFERIDRADVVIADISGLNSNVMLEFGYAISAGKQIVMITDKQTKDKIPANLRGRLFIEYERSENELERLSTLIATYVRQAIQLVNAQTITDKYEVTCYRNRAVILLGERFRNASRRIDILTTNVKYFAESLSSDIKAALDAHSNLTVRVLTLAPESSIAARRATQLNLDTYRYRTELRESIGLLLKEFRDYEDRFQLRLYDDLPTQMTFIIDDTIITSVVSVTTRSRQNLHFELHASGVGALESFIYHFETVWGRAPVPLQGIQF